MSHIAINPSVISVTLAGIREDMQALYPMNEREERFFDYMIGIAPSPPNLRTFEKLHVVNSFLLVVDGFPIARTFSQTPRFRPFEIAREVSYEYRRMSRNSVASQQSNRSGRRTAKRRH
jgi:hypothetical protein